jgi:hypothetical protein
MRPTASIIIFIILIILLWLVISRKFSRLWLRPGGSMFGFFLVRLMNLWDGVLLKVGATGNCTGLVLWSRKGYENAILIVGLSLRVFTLNHTVGDTNCSLSRYSLFEEVITESIHMGCFFHAKDTICDSLVEANFIENPV